MLPDDAFVSYRIVSKAVEAMLTGMSRSICATHRRWEVEFTTGSCYYDK
jgi:hypothetical protein